MRTHSPPLESPMNDKPRRPALLSQGAISLICIVGGAMFGCLPTALSYFVDFSTGRLWFIYKTSAPTNFLASAILGAFVGFVCLAPAFAILAGRPRRIVILILISTTAPAVLGISLWLGLIQNKIDALVPLMALSACAFILACFIAAWKAPRYVERVGLCEQCGYDLRGSLDVGRCPECGLRFRPKPAEDTPINGIGGDLADP